MQIRPAKITDLPAVKKLLLAAGVFSREEIEVAAELLELSAAESRDYFFRAAEDEDGRISSIVCWGPVPLTRGTFDLYWIASDPGGKVKGAAGSLLERAEEEIKNKGGRLLVAETSSRDVYRPAHSFYRKKGFSRAAVIPDYYAPGDNLIIFTKKL